jgi:deoxyadenosine/deoxycytidine kinase
MQQTKPRVIVVDGNIASGKTSFIKIIVEYLSETGLRVRVIKEPVDDWKSIGILEKFYKNPKKYAYAFQTYVFSSRIQKAITKYEKYKHVTDLFISERSWFTDRIFADINYKDKNINSMEYALYNTWSDFYTQFAPFEPDGFVYLRCSEDVSHERYLKRSREGECNIAKEYLCELLEAHDNMFCITEHNPTYNTGTKEVPVLVVDSTRNFIEDVDARQDACLAFEKFIAIKDTEKLIVRNDTEKFLAINDTFFRAECSEREYSKVIGYIRGTEFVALQ